MRISLRNISNIWWAVYGWLVFGIFFSVADQQLGKAGLIPGSPTFLALLSLTPFAIAAIFRTLRSQKSLSVVFEPLRANLVPILCFAGVAFWSLCLSMLPGSFWGDGGKWIFLTSYGFVITCLALFVPLQPVVSKLLPLYLFSALLALLASMYVDLAYPGTFSSVPTRAAGFPGNSNFAAVVTVMLCACALDYEGSRSPWFNRIFLLLTFLAVAATMSRSGLLNFLALLVFYVVNGFLAHGVNLKKLVRMVGMCVMLAFLVGTSIELFASNLGLFQPSSRLMKFLQNEQVDDGSTASRLSAVADSLVLINESPIIGHGTGHARTMEELPHNLYLQQWVNNGLPGLLAYLALLGASFAVFSRRRYRSGQALIMVTALGSLFSHNILDQRPFLMLLGIQLTQSAIFTSRSRRSEVPKAAPIMRPVFPVPVNSGDSLGDSRLLAAVRARAEADWLVHGAPVTDTQKFWYAAEAEMSQLLRERAYEIYVSEGRPEGRSELHWKQATEQLAAGAANYLRQQIRPGRPPGGIHQ